jgi:class 3 adenylate cyclase
MMISPMRTEAEHQGGEGMDFVAVVDQVIALLRQRGRVTYRTLQIQFTLDDEQPAALKDELLYSQPQVVDDAGRGLVWTGNADPASSATLAPVETPGLTPLAYTPPYLAEKLLTSTGVLEGERKQVTVLFADLKGSMELIQGLDPEEARKLLDPALHIMMEAVHRYEGTVNHVLTHEVAYSSLLQERRRALHARIVETFEALAGEGAPLNWRPSADAVAGNGLRPAPTQSRQRVAKQGERLAHHALRGEVWNKALAYFRQVGEKAMARSAHREAGGYFEQALSALEHLPETRDTREQSIDLRFALCRALRPSGDFRHALASVREAEALALAIDDSRRHAPRGEPHGHIVLHVAPRHLTRALFTPRSVVQRKSHLFCPVVLHAILL